jgi:hypothetical protein
MTPEDDAVQRALLAAAVEQVKLDNRRMESEFRANVAAMEDRFEKYVEKALFDAHQSTMEQRIKPLELIVKGMVGLVLMGVGTAILSLIIQSGP